MRSWLRSWIQSHQLCLSRAVPLSRYVTLVGWLTIKLFALAIQYQYIYAWMNTFAWCNDLAIGVVGVFVSDALLWSIMICFELESFWRKPGYIWIWTDDERLTVHLNVAGGSKFFDMKSMRMWIRFFFRISSKNVHVDAVKCELQS